MRMHSMQKLQPDNRPGLQEEPDGRVDVDQGLTQGRGGRGHGVRGCADQHTAQEGNLEEWGIVKVEWGGNAFCGWEGKRACEIHSTLSSSSHPMP
eukprot:1151036-Pelagomonas_calceolata.AAC.6